MWHRLNVHFNYLVAIRRIARANDSTILKGFNFISISQMITTEYDGSTQLNFTYAIFFLFPLQQSIS